jgi:hypothetical protein
MNYLIIRQILTGYENQLSNAIIQNDTNKIEWLKEQIANGHKALSTATYLK